MDQNQNFEYEIKSFFVDGNLFKIFLGNCIEHLYIICYFNFQQSRKKFTSAQIDVREQKIKPMAKVKMFKLYFSQNIKNIFKIRWMTKLSLMFLLFVLLAILLVGKKKALFKKRKTVTQELDKKLHQISTSIKFHHDQLNKFDVQKIDKNLLQRYTQKVYKNYPISNFLEREQREKKSFEKQQRAIQLKKQFIKQLNNEQQKISYRNIVKIKHPPETQSHQKHFIYCFLCQAQIFSENMIRHESIECPQLSAFYQLSVEQIDKFILKKLKRIHEQALQLKEKMKNENSRKACFDQLIQKTDEYLEAFHQNLDFENNWQNNQLMRKFRNFEESYQEYSLQLYETIKKLNWFSSMYNNFLSFINQSMAKEQF